MGITQWVPQAANDVQQLVAIANAKLYYSDNDGSTWTEITPGSGVLSTTVMADFAPMLVGTTPLLFIASGSDLFSWNGTAITKRDLVNDIPNPNALCRVFGNRLFITSSDAPNTLYWSKLGDGTDFRVGGLSDGGFAVVFGDSEDEIIALEVLGSSLLIATRHSIARFTGTADDIQILTDTEGVTTNVGPVYNVVSNQIKPHTGSFQSCDQVVMMWTDRGPYAVTEGGVVPMGDKINTEGRGRTDVQWRDRTVPAYVVFHRRRMETWFVFRSMADSGASSAYVYSHRRRCFSGPFQFSIDITSICQADIAGVPTIIAGCGDGFVRLLDDTTVNRDDNATNYTHQIWLAPFIFDAAGPHNTKKIRHIFLQVERPLLSTEPTVKISADGGAEETAVLIVEDGAIETPNNLRYDVDSEGKRFVVKIEGSFGAGTSADDISIIGCIVKGSIMDRWS
jgi:hypothetical protein